MEAMNGKVNSDSRHVYTYPNVKFLRLSTLSFVIPAITHTVRITMLIFSHDLNI